VEAPNGTSISSCPYQGLRNETSVWADVLDEDEFAVWCTAQDVDDIQVFAPDGSSIGTFAPGDRIDFDTAGVYKFDIPGHIYDTIPGFSTVTAKFPWDIQVFSTSCGLTGTSLCPTGMGGNGDVDRGDACEENGRIYSTRWVFNTGSFLQGAATDASYFARVPGGSPDQWAVIELALGGLSGFVYELIGNRVGVTGHGGRSVFGRFKNSGGEYETRSARPEFSMYLNPPQDADYQVTTPERPDVTVSSGAQGCTQEISPGQDPPVTFSWESNVEGTYQFICDLDDDETFDITTDDDVLVNGILNVGENSFEWRGFDNEGEPIRSGTIDNPEVINCVLRLTVGEFHYVGEDMETSFEGLRIFEVTRDLDDSIIRSSLNMFWNDQALQPYAVTLENPPPRETLPWSGPFSAVTSGPLGLVSGDPLDPAVPYVQDINGDIVLWEGETGNARAWGNFDRGLNCSWCESGCEGDPDPGPPEGCHPDTQPKDQGSGNGKGNAAFLDTYTWLEAADSDPIILLSIGTRDLDDDGLTDWEEACNTNTDYEDCDTDDDSINDLEETGSGLSRDTDGDTIADALDPDDDGDCIETIDEVLNGVPGDGTDCTDPTDIFTDSNATPDRLDDDDDGDTVLTIEEGVCEDDVFTPQNTDDDAFPDHLDPDDDGDSIPTEDEDVEIVNDDPTDDDTDDDGTPNYLDVDDDGDCILTIDEDLDEDSDPTDDDFDFDDVVNYLDPDDDGDTVPTRIEGDCDESGDEPEYTEWDTDEDEDPDHLDVNDDGDARDTIDEDPNDNDDPTDDDSDGDRIPDYLDADDQDGPLGDRDNDGVPNRDDNCPDTPNADQANVDGDEDGDVCDDDIDGDEIPNDDDNCPTIANVEQEDFDEDGEGDVCDDDRDGDGEPNEDDNCPDTPNPEQEDVNFDGIGDTCQGDADEDGIPDVADNCVDDPNPNQGNVDGDSNGDVCDEDIDDDGLTNDEEENTYGTDPYMADTDGGGVPDGEEVERRTDPLDRGDDPGPYEVTGGSAFTCSSTSTDSSGWFGIMAALAGLVFIRRRREER